MSRLLSFPLTLPVRFKAPSLSRRTKVLAVILAVATGLAAGFVLLRTERVGVTSQRGQMTGASTSAGLRAARARALDVAAHIVKTRLRIEERSRTADASHAESLFASHSWYVAPPPPPPPPPPSAPTAASLAPPVPTAPPLPFQYIGSFKPDGGAQVFFLMQGDRVYDVRTGDTLDNTYSVDGFNGSQLLLTYKPLKIQQQLSVGATQ